MTKHTLKRIGAFTLALVILLPLFTLTSSASDDSEPTPDPIPDPAPDYAALMMALEEKYPTGTRYTNSTSYVWKGGFFHAGKGCMAFAFMLSDAAFGDVPARYCTDFSELRVGDVVRINKDKHSVIILEMDGTTITVAEANYNSAVLWGRTFTYQAFESAFNYALTRYDDDAGTSPERPIYDDPESAEDVIVPSDDDNFTINLTTETLNTPSGYKISSYSVDGGVKWKALQNEARDPTNPRSPFHPTKLGRLFKSGKTTELWISSGVLEKNADKKKVPGGDTPAVIVKFEIIEGASQNEVKANRFAVNYLLKADNTGLTAGNWVFVERGSKNPTDSISSESGVIFGPAVMNNGKAGKTASEWFKVNADGVPVSDVAGSNSTYFYRVAPKDKGDSGNWVAGGKMTKVRVLGLRKAPKVKGYAKVKPQDFFSTDGVIFMKGPNAKIAGIKHLFLGATDKKPRSAKGKA
ncbi:MAG: hypothetical protein LBI19_06070 [Oscillospiraceae bacterium]|nr:hypothetical protein [Oscillospiraceae bacterium]